MWNRGFKHLLLGITFALFVLALQATTAQAAPAAPIDIPLTQPDGTVFTARQWGDEWMHGFETLDGYSILMAEDGYWVYAGPGAEGALVPVMVDGQMLKVGQADAPEQAMKARPVLPADSPAYTFRTGAPERGQNIGNQKLLMVMVKFQNRSNTYPASTFQALGFGASNSIRDFYRDASFNQLTFDPAAETQGTANDGMVEVTLAMNHPNDSDQSRTVATAVYNAINPYVNFANFDTNSDGYITSRELHTIFIIAGYEEAYGSCTSYCWWAHAWNLASALTLDGKYVGTDNPSGDPGGYATFGEIHSNHPAQVGIMVHELGHDISWPDLYDVDNSSSGVGYWSVMGGGSWGGLSYAGDSPALPDAWLKYYQGWITPTIAANGQTYTLDQASTTGEALLMGTNPGGVDWDFGIKSGAGEYFLVENRQYSGYDAALPGCGIMIWHIDETRSPSNQEANANEARPLVHLEQADGFNNLASPSDEGDTGDPYPGSSNNRNFNNTTNPNSRYYNGSDSGHRLAINSTSCASAMSVTYTSQVTAKPHRVFMPMLQHIPYVPPLTGRVTYRGTPASSVKIDMYYSENDGDDWVLRASTNTDASGNYSFASPPAVGNGKLISVEWENLASYNTSAPLLAYWVCEQLDGSSTDKRDCSFDIEDVRMNAPAAGSTINLPYTFTWYARATTSDKYEVDWWNSDYGHYMWTTNPLNYTNNFRLYSIPDYWYLNSTYWWAVYPYGSNGYGIPYYIWAVRFADRSSPELTMQPANSLNISEGYAGRHAPRGGSLSPVMVGGE